MNYCEGKYYKVSELRLICKKYKLQTSGGKLDLEERIRYFLSTGKVLISKYKNNKTIFDTQNIPKDIKFGIETRKFFSDKLGKKIRFNIAFMDFCRKNPDTPWEIAIPLLSKCKQSKTISPQFKYNQYVRDFFADPKNKGKKISECIKCWKYKSSQNGIHKYEFKDILFLENNN